MQTLFLVYSLSLFHPFIVHLFLCYLNNRYHWCISLLCHRASTSLCHKLEEEKHSGFWKAFRIFYILKLLLSPFPRRLQAILFSLLTFLYFTFLLWLHVINQTSQTLSVDALCLVSDYILLSLVWDAHGSKKGKRRRLHSRNSLRLRKENKCQILHAIIKKLTNMCACWNFFLKFNGLCMASSFSSVCWHERRKFCWWKCEYMMQTRWH